MDKHTALHPFGSFATDVFAGDDPHVAFGDAIQSALEEAARGDVWPSIAGKDCFLIVSDIPRDEEEAWSLAEGYLANPDAYELRRDRLSVHSPYGPAGAIRVYDGWVFFGWEHPDYVNHRP